MNFDLGPDEIALRDGVRDLCHARFADPRAVAVDAGAWRALGEAGIFAMRLPSDAGGIGAGLTQAVIVFQELGRALVPGPLVASTLAAASVEGAAAGERIVGLADDGLLEHPGAAQTALRIDGDGVWVVDAAGAEAVARPLDPLTPLARTHALPRGERVGSAADAAMWRLEGAVLTAALQAGIAARVTEMAVAYAKQREQFGRVIGSFQAVKHLCADMHVRAEVARAAVDAAGVLLDGPDGDAAARAVASAKAVSDEAAIANAKAAIQVHGGMGFTWEVDVHLFLKRALVNATRFGSAAAHAEAVAGCL